MLNHGGGKGRSKQLHENLTEQVIGAATEVHRALGASLLESAYVECPCHELNLRTLKLRRQVPLPVEFKGDCGYRVDVLVEESVILELKCVEHVLPVHEAQLLTYLKMTGKRVGLTLNFHLSTLVRGGILRKVA